MNTQGNSIRTQVRIETYQLNLDLAVQKLVEDRAVQMVRRAVNAWLYSQN